MPLYEYECGCGHKFEELRPMLMSSEDALCPKCGSLAQRIMSPFKWYMGWRHLENIKSEPAPNDAGYHPKWDD